MLCDSSGTNTTLRTFQRKRPKLICHHRFPPSPHLRVRFEMPSTQHRLFQHRVGFSFTTQVPQSIFSALRLGRMTALRIPSGGVRGIVVGDVLRRLVARTLAQQFAKKSRDGHCPFQFALSTWAGCECVSHALQSDLDESATILSVDGVGAFHLVSRKSMLQGLLNMEGGDSLFFRRQFHGSPSTFLWEDELGTVNHVQQGEGGEQGDRLMPMLFALGQHSALVAVSKRLQEGRASVCIS